MSGSITVFVRPLQRTFHANTLQADAISATSAAEAVQRCAARHLNSDERSIEVLETADPFVYIASVRPPRADARDRGALWFAIGFGLLGMVATWLLCHGGAR